MAISIACMIFSGACGTEVPTLQPRSVELRLYELAAEVLSCFHHSLGSIISAS